MDEGGTSMTMTVKQAQVYCELGNNITQKVKADIRSAATCIRHVQDAKRPKEERIDQFTNAIFMYGAVFAIEAIKQEINAMTEAGLIRNGSLSKKIKGRLCQSIMLATMIDKNTITPEAILDNLTDTLTALKKYADLNVENIRACVELKQEVQALFTKIQACKHKDRLN